MASRERSPPSTASTTTIAASKRQLFWYPRGSRQSRYARPASLAPSIGRQLGWLWTTLAFVSLLVSQPAYSAPSAHQPRRLAQAALRYSLATLVWLPSHTMWAWCCMLVLATSMLVFEAVGAMRAVSAGAEGDKKVDGEVDGQSEGEKVQVQSEDEQGNWMRTWSLRLVGAVVGLGWWMLFMTSIWFHTWLEKWSGLLIALGTVYVVYVLR
ncbi:uncharacterized protein P174DRAFT_516643 [Aspergillus novofumigatus IBT 16806]|uniref:Uncharacterized protein n=1 Tax=Aspergillus novofumigatus (strain IBT 16806) TaxID=1392255 RepID=A0A2I1BS30_ASPN1|nr:uncharacterized protein P174DRAFT_516643 [Aspergillus novofumigatus IBT 16806]PKX88166.1 hypothetical protein P174DRAFT_516643 [Aspergillus novofumigatus IBT 16806]